MYTVNISKRQLIWGIAVFIFISIMILGALVAQDAHAQGLEEYLLAVGLPVCVTSEVDPDNMNPAGKPRDGELGHIRIPLYYNEAGELRLDLGPCNANEFPLVIEWNCVGELGGDFSLDNLFCRE
ncbi:MAG: hypothetical protein PVF74_08905 [Anaerolineales bacterium]